jgi:hypothetical protein
VINHIQVLEAAGLIRVEARGRERINRLNITPLREIHNRWLTPFEQLWAGRLLGLARAAEANSLLEDSMDPVRAVTITQAVRCAAPPPVVWQTLTARPPTSTAGPPCSAACAQRPRTRRNRLTGNP